MYFVLISFSYHKMVLSLGKTTLANINEVAKGSPTIFCRLLYETVLDYIFVFCTEGKFYVYLWNYGNTNTTGHFIAINNGLVISDEVVSKNDKRARTLILENNEYCKNRFLNYICLGTKTGIDLYAVKPKRQALKRKWIKT